MGPAELKALADEVDKRFQAWIFRHNAQRGTAFTPEQTDWLRLMKDHIASSCSINRPDFDFAELADKGGCSACGRCLAMNWMD